MSSTCKTNTKEVPHKRHHSRTPPNIGTKMDKGNTHHSITVRDKKQKYKKPKETKQQTTCLFDQL